MTIIRERQGISKLGILLVLYLSKPIIMDIANNLAIVLIAFRLKMDEQGTVNQQVKNDVLKLIESFGDGMSPAEFYKYLQLEEKNEAA
jgi:hypothetical protein